MNKIILFDIDYTLFDTTKFKEVIAEKIAALSHQNSKELYLLLEEVYYEARRNGRFEPSLFPRIMQKRLGIQNLEDELAKAWSISKPNKASDLP